MVDTSPYPIAANERRIAAIQLLVAALIGGGAWLVRARLQAIEPIAEGVNVIELLLDSSLWAGLFLFAISYVLVAAAMGYAFGTLAALGWLASGPRTGARRRALLVGPVIAAVGFVVVAVWLA